jgi:hypothetical protein
MYPRRRWEAKSRIVKDPKGHREPVQSATGLRKDRRPVYLYLPWERGSFGMKYRDFF